MKDYLEAQLKDITAKIDQNQSSCTKMLEQSKVQNLVLQGQLIAVKAALAELDNVAKTSQPAR